MRRETLERIFRTARQHPEDLNWTVGPSEIVAAAAVVAVGLPADEAVMREIARWDLDVASLVIPDSDPELADAALAALLIAAGRGARRETGSFTGRTGIGRLLVT